MINGFNKNIQVMLLTLAVAMFGVACSGGIIGTSTGPSTGDDLKPTYRLNSFPSKLGPRIPKTLQSDSQAGTQLLSSPEVVVSRSWQQLSPAVSHAESTRLKVQEALTLLDTVFTTILEACGESPVSCNLPEGTVQAQYTQDVIDKLQLLIGYDTKNSSANATEAPYQEKLGSWFVFSQIKYIKQSDDSYDHNIWLDTVALLDNRHLEVKWSDDKADTSYAVLSHDESGISEYYRYQSGTNGQYLNFHWNSDADTEFDPITFELNAEEEDSGPVTYTAYLNGQIISGRATELEGYTSAMQYESSGVVSNYFQESFVEFGELIDRRDCDANLTGEVDCSFDEFESDIYVTEASFGEDVFELADVVVSNVPANIFEFEVRQGSSLGSEEVPAIYCHGFQYPGVSPASETFCFEEPHEMINPVVIGFDEFGQEVPILEATVEFTNAE